MFWKSPFLSVITLKQIQKSVTMSVDENKSYCLHCAYYALKVQREYQAVKELTAETLKY